MLDGHLTAAPAGGVALFLETITREPRMTVGYRRPHRRCGRVQASERESDEREREGRCGVGERCEQGDRQGGRASAGGSFLCRAGGRKRWGEGERGSGGSQGEHGGS